MIIKNAKSKIIFYSIIGVIFFVIINLCWWWAAKASSYDNSYVAFNKYYSQWNTWKYIDENGESQWGNYRIDPDGDGELNWNMRENYTDDADAYFTRFHDQSVQKIDKFNNSLGQPVKMYDLFDQDEVEHRYNYTNKCNLEEDIEIGYGNTNEDKNGGDYVFSTGDGSSYHNEVYNIDLAIEHKNHTSLVLSYNVDISWFNMQMRNWFGIYAKDINGNEIRLGKDFQAINSYRHIVHSGHVITQDIAINDDQDNTINEDYYLQCYRNNPNIKGKIQNPTSLFELANKSADDGGIIIRLDSMVVHRSL